MAEKTKFYPGDEASHIELLIEQAEDKTQRALLLALFRMVILMGEQTTTLNTHADSIQNLDKGVESLLKKDSAQVARHALWTRFISVIQVIVIGLCGLAWEDVRTLHKADVELEKRVIILEQRSLKNG